MPGIWRYLGSGRTAKEDLREMDKKTITIGLASALAFALAGTAGAGELRFVGTGYFEINEDFTKVTLNSPDVRNTAVPDDYSGTYYFVLVEGWLLNDPFDGYGHLLIGIDIAPMREGDYKSPRTITGDMPSIPAGNYCQVVTLWGKGASWEDWEIHDEIEGQCRYYDPTPVAEPSTLAGMTTALLAVWGLAGWRRLRA
jgi:hypothetical protein